MTDQRHNKTFLLISLIVLVAAAGLYFFLYHSVGISATEIMQGRMTLEIDQIKTEKSENIAELYKRTAPDRDEIEGYLIPGGQAVSFIEALEAVGHSAGTDLALSSIATGDIAGIATDTLVAVDAHVDAGGSWTQVMRTLMLCESLPYASSIDNVRLNSTVTGTKGERSWDISFDIEAAMAATSSDQVSFVSQ